jgi:hypothetical protein
LPASTATPVLLDLTGSLLRPLADTPYISGGSDHPLLPLVYWLGQEANDQILDLLNARLDQSQQLGRIQAWRVFRDELEPWNHKRPNRSVFTVATAQSPSRIGSLRLGSHNGSQLRSQKLEQASDLQFLGGAEGI